MIKQNNRFEVISEYKPSGDQPKAIKELAERINNGEKDIVLLGATGTGKSATTAWLIEKIQRPTLIIEPNKTLAAQMAGEFRSLLPNNAIEYFVSYYDYYQPEAYIPQSDTYIEKDSSINDEVERLRHSATVSLLTRRDTVVVASVSCIYGLGEPTEYMNQSIALKVGDSIDMNELFTKFINMQYNRNDIAFERGNFRVRGDVVEIIPVYEELAIRIEFFGNTIEKLSLLHPITANKIDDISEVFLFPATHYAASEESLKDAIGSIKTELAQRIEFFKKRKMLVEAQRIEMRTNFDLEMLEQTRTCRGVENYSAHFDKRFNGEPPNTLLDFFDDDYLLIIDESHITVPQIGAMYEGDAARKRSLIDHGFRLPSALDNRPLKFSEFEEKIGQTVYLSATPGKYELDKQFGTDNLGKPVELIIRPTSLIDPEIEIRKTKGQVDDLLKEIHTRVENDERVLITTLTKKMAEDLTDYFVSNGVKTEYLHSDVETLKRIELLKDLRLGKFSVLVGINLLREGLDLPEVSLVAIMDADQQGFLRSFRSLIQTIGRAARNVNGKVIMYADSITDAMKEAIDETNRRRSIQIEYNKRNNITPKPLNKKIESIADDLEMNETLKLGNEQDKPMNRDELLKLIDAVSNEMKNQASLLNFENAARLRDELQDLQKLLKLSTK